MSKTCQKHIENPVRIYSQCVGCELERLQEDYSRLDKIKNIIEKDIPGHWKVFEIQQILKEC